MESGDILNGRYQIEEKIGAGRTSNIYRALDQQTGEKVAVKSIRRELLVSNPDGTMRFMREGATLKQMNHPHVVKVTDTFDSGDGSYIIMELLPNGSLADRILQNGAFSIDDGFALSKKLTDAMAYLHGLNIVHRDLTPLNILFDSKDEPHIMDFSVARMGHMSPMTIKGQLLGSMAYMAPEIILGQSSANVKTDIWALGIIFYEIFAGQQPFTFKKTVDVMQMAQTPAPLICTLRADVPKPIERLINRMLMINPVERIATMQSVMDSLKQV